jgi:organic hydroperoxide reductase OsmC/OhrA
MTDREHTYKVQLEWSGNLGTGTSAYGTYSRAYEISVAGKPPIAASADPAFRGDTARHNPEELLVGALSGCHMLSYLHLCAQAKIVVLAYRDTATGVMTVDASGAGRFREVTLHPVARLAAGTDVQRATALHERAHTLCFIARSVNFPVQCEPTFETA